VGSSDLFPFDGVEVYKGMNGTALQFRTIFGRNGITVTQGTDHLLIEASGTGGGEVNTASNLGAGNGVYATKVGADLRFKSLVAGSNVTITPDANTLTIAATIPALNVPGSTYQILVNKNGALGVASGFKYEDFSDTLHVLSLAPSGVNSAAFIENYGHANSSLILAAPNLVLGSLDDKLSFYNGTPQAKISITGSRGGNLALTNLLTALSSLGLITNSTTA
jgi:hypothetical protein